MRYQREQQRQLGDILGPLFGDNQFENIVRFMSGRSANECPLGEINRPGSEKCIALVYEGVEAVRKIRDVLGPTDPSKAPPGSIRREFGQTVMVNAAHASDSPENAQREMGIINVAENSFRQVGRRFLRKSSRLEKFSRRRFLSAEWHVRIRLLLGPAGSGKTFRCLTEIRKQLSVSEQGAPLLLIAPKQTTYQLERQFLEYASIPGYTRLFILSFERLAHFIFQSLGQASPALLEEQGRVMVLRSLLSRHRDELRIFRASSKLTGFAQQLSQALRELQSQQLTPESLRALAERFRGGLQLKLLDLATLFGLYQKWLVQHDLQDGDSLLKAAAAILEGSETAGSPPDRINAAAAATPLSARAMPGPRPPRGRGGNLVRLTSYFWRSSILLQFPAMEPGRRPADSNLAVSGWTVLTSFPRRKSNCSPP